MLNYIQAAGEAVKGGSKIVDKHTESAEERNKTLSDRHEQDMNSDNRLSKSIRPMTLLILLGLELIVVVLSAMGKTVDQTIVIQLGVLLSGAFGFYFNSKKAERVAAKNALANIRIEKIKARTQQ